MEIKKILIVGADLWASEVVQLKSSVDKSNIQKISYIGNILCSTEDTRDKVFSLCLLDIQTLFELWLDRGRTNVAFSFEEALAIINRISEDIILVDCYTSEELGGPMGNPIYYLREPVLNHPDVSCLKLVHPDKIKRAARDCKRESSIDGLFEL